MTIKALPLSAAVICASVSLGGDGSGPSESISLYCSLRFSGSHWPRGSSSAWKTRFREHRTTLRVSWVRHQWGQMQVPLALVGQGRLPAKLGLPDMLRPRAKGCHGNLASRNGASHKRRPAWQEGLELAGFPAAHGRLNFGFEDRPRPRPLSLPLEPSVTMITVITYASQLLGGPVRMLQMAACLVRVRYEWLPSRTGTGSGHERTREVASHSH